MLTDSKRAVVQASVGYQSDSSICAQTAEYLHRLLQVLHPDLSAVLGVRPIGGGAPDLSSWLAEAGSDRTRRQQWQSVGEELELYIQRRHDKEFAPQCVLVLPSTSLTEDDQRTQLAAALTGVRDRFSSFLLFLLDETGTLTVGDNDRERIPCWLESFRELASPGCVHLYLAAATLDTGQPVETNDFAEAVAIALCADLVLASRDSPRVLTGKDLPSGVVLCSLGLRALRFDPEAIAGRFADRLAGELLSKTALAAGTTPRSHAANEPVASLDLLAGAFASDPQIQARLLVSTSLSNDFPDDVPVLSGPAGEMTVDLGAVSKGMDLDKVPRRLWKEQLSTWDFLLREGRVPRLVARLSTAIDRRASGQLESLADRVAETFTEPGGAAAAEQMCAEVSHRVRSDYSLTLHEAATVSLEANLKSLDKALAAIPHGPSLWARVVVLLAVLILLGVGAWRMEPSGLRNVLFTASALMALGTVAMAYFRRSGAEAQAQLARDETLEHSENRGRYACCSAIQNKLDALRDRWLTELNEMNQRAAASTAAIQSSTQLFTPSEHEKSSQLVHHVPEREQEENLYEMIVGRELLAGHGDTLAPEFAESLRKSVREVLAGNVAAATLSDRIVAYVRETLVSRIMARCRLWHFMRERIGQGDGFDPHVTKRLVGHLDAETPFVCLQGRVAVVALLELPAGSSYFSAPAVLKEIAPENLRYVESSDENTAAVITRVELGSLACDAPQETER